MKFIKELDKEIGVNKTTKRKNRMSIFNIILFILLIEAVVVNQFFILAVNAHMNIGMYRSQSVGNDSIDLSGNLSQDVVKLILVKGAPAIYGNELGISFDQVQASINVLRQFDPGYGQRKIILSEDRMKDYIDIGLRISCEFCCSAKSIVFANGRAACGCAHSQAVRGLAAYLLKYHRDQYTNDQILSELSQWKGLYFPKQMMKKLANQISSGNYTPDIASLLIELDLPDYGSAGNVPLPTEINNLPSMVGGC